ncbi:tRNA uridine-5-carboxymethylaminomethyl(34) synthesis GTPase MnmE [Thalassospira xiamenensis]|uniref:tRNA uridine-5-carboxymethylaminomethyl(34) synthesis GTPase MnmE n=1 Tax=Thalassospira xiamenensis TaxID=220697 RepID=UPI0007A3C0AD|nr:tRNA uridine-5-carboxymethylaminomethyl(34) synthesis GTPase MnmE [Thalassospira xiamenensis]KZB52381.1 tRNA modification GTPase MnmE [Thalassospira xiamenensis]MCK2168399.1 tRNA uridine-5-carboxymethylaminomethyl(34) synthesis GTPase MnmE [Thalassospira xiamenensis]
MTINVTHNGTPIKGGQTDTIFALSSGAGRAGVAVIRLSGPMAGPTLCALLGRDNLPKARHAIYAPIRDPKTDERLDDAVAIYFAGPASFTGEDVVELHTHGGRAVIDGVLECLAAQPGLRIAEPGEYTRRAFENGKMDLTAAEGIADLIDAETAAQRRQAVRQMAGELGALYEDWRARLMKALAYIEADIDFPDEDLPGGIVPVVRGDLASVYGEMTKHLADNRRGERLREGFQIVILGAPNAGKSSLLNRLARRDAAIVSEIAGTTRDMIEVHLDLGGFPVTMVDTAGLRESGDVIETEGVRRATARAEDADLRLVVVDRGDWPRIDAEAARLIEGNTILLINKVDVADTGNVPAVWSGQSAGGDQLELPVLPISAMTGQGMESLLQLLETRVKVGLDFAGPVPLTRLRHRQALERASDHLDRGLQTDIAELAAEDIRLAVREIGKITGRVDVEDLLDIIFGDFCIGK